MFIKDLKNAMNNIQITKHQLITALFLTPIPYLAFLLHFYKGLFYDYNILEALGSLSIFFSLFLAIYIFICCPIFYWLCLKLIKHNFFNSLAITFMATTITVLCYVYDFLANNTNTHADLAYFPPLYIFSLFNIISFLSIVHFLKLSNLKLNDKN